MSAPLEITNRFEIITVKDAGALARILDQFARNELHPTNMNVRESRGETWMVSLSVNSLDDDLARSLCTRLRLDKGVRQAFVEHVIRAA